MFVSLLSFDTFLSTVSLFVLVLFLFGFLYGGIVFMGLVGVGLGGKVAAGFESRVESAIEPIYKGAIEKNCG